MKRLNIHRMYKYTDMSNMYIFKYHLKTYVLRLTANVFIK